MNEHRAERLGPLGAIALHLLPGALATALFVLIADPVQDAGFPPLLAFMVAVLLVIVPFELGVVLRASRRTGSGGALASVPYRESMGAREWAILVPAVTVAAVIGFGALSLLDAPIRDALFGWLPDWFRELVPVDAIGSYSTSAWTVTLAAYAAINILIGPVVEEIYFRGYLLPRLSQLGRWAPLVNTVLFSLYHFWTPWAFVARIAGVAPFAYAVWWKRNVYLGMVVHVLLNAIGTVTLIALVMQELS